MSHIHTLPGQHDMTVSGYIVRKDENGEWLCLIHLHRKLGVFMQIGGHIELDETPWHAIAHELAEESGYCLSELQILQPFATLPKLPVAIVHPLPLIMNTHHIMQGHYHSDQCYVFVAEAEPAHYPADGESQELEWLTLSSLDNRVTKGIVLEDVAVMYRHIIETLLPQTTLFLADSFSTKEPVGDTNVQMPRYYFTRHGESVANATETRAGWSDSPLTEKGKRGAALEADRLRKEGKAFDLIISSPLLRAVETAKIIAAHTGYPVADLRIEDSLKERGFGKFEGKPLAALLPGDARAIAEAGGEELKVFVSRVEESFANVRALSIGKKRVLIVGHGGWFRMATALMQGKDTATFYTLTGLENNKIIEFPL